MIDKIIYAIRKIAGATLIPDNVRDEFYKGAVAGLLRMPENVTLQQWGNTHGMPKPTTNQSLIDPSIINRYMHNKNTNYANLKVTRAHAAERMLWQQDWSPGVGKQGATTDHARIMGMLMGRARIKNYRQGGSRNVKPGGYGALTKNLLDAARAWFGYGADMSDLQVQQNVLQLLRRLARTKPQPSAYGRGITNYGNNTMPA